MKSIPLKGTSFVALVDDEDYEKLMKTPYRKWLYWMTADGQEYARCRTKLTNGKWTTILMHRIVMDAQAGEEVDHWSRDGLDNRKMNLRLCTSSQNHMNQAKTRGGSQYKGVYWDKARKKWHAQIGFEGQHFALGRFATQVEAAHAYNRKATELFGEFALLNELEAV